MSTLPAADQSRASLALQQSSHPALRCLTVEENDEAIIVSGRVSSYYLKQLAQELIMQASIGRELVNRVTVIPRERR